VNQYYNYRKWRLARYNYGPTEHDDFWGTYKSEGEHSFAPAKKGSDGMSDFSPTREKIDNYPDHESPGGTVQSSSRKAISYIHDGLNKVLDNLRYVLPHSAMFQRPQVSISHAHYPHEAETTYEKFSPTRFIVASRIIRNKRQINQALAHYAGALFHNVLLGYNEHHVPSVIDHSGHSNSYFPALDEMQETGEFPGLQDIPTKSIFHPKKIKALEKDVPGGLPHRKAAKQSILTNKIEDLGLVAAHRGSELYKQYLDQGHPGTFEDFLTHSDFNLTSTKDKLMHDLLIQMVQGLHLPER